MPKDHESTFPNSPHGYSHGLYRILSTYTYIDNNNDRFCIIIHIQITAGCACTSSTNSKKSTCCFFTVYHVYMGRLLSFFLLDKYYTELSVSVTASRERDTGDTSEDKYKPTLHWGAINKLFPSVARAGRSTIPVPIVTRLVSNHFQHFQRLLLMVNLSSFDLQQRKFA